MSGAPTTAHAHNIVAVTVDADNRIHAAVGGFNTTNPYDFGELRYLTSANGTTWTDEVID